jgi:hypothetical protein
MTALIHILKLPAALEASNTFFFSNYGFKINAFSFAILEAGIALIFYYLNYFTLLINFAFNKFFLLYAQKSCIFYIEPGSLGVNLIF